MTDRSRQYLHDTLTRSIAKAMAREGLTDKAVADRIARRVLRDPRLDIHALFPSARADEALGASLADELVN